jgi:predicted nucleic acid-binding protein
MNSSKAMQDRYVLDTYAWVEYFRKSPLADRIEGLIENSECFTPPIVIAELQTKFLRDGLNFTKAFHFIDAKTVIVALDKFLALSAGKINFERKKINPHWSLADSVVLATAREIKAKVVTGDEDFRDLKEEVLMLK